MGEEGILYADLDVDRARAARMQFDPVGHYGRADVFRLTVDSGPRRSVSFPFTEDRTVSGELGGGDAGGGVGE
ncbi:MAG TPA: hypothetical protein VGF00_16915 [Acidimicrobiia bacterium]